MFDARLEILDERAHKYAVIRSGEPVSYGETLLLWQDNEAFRAFFISLLAESPFSAYRWETPPFTVGTAGRPFEFVLRNSPELAGPPDAATFAPHFEHDLRDGIIVFANLGQDALLVVPAPWGPAAHYGHLAAFTRGAPASQQHALWRTVGETMEQYVTERPIWLSTAGGGVAWLHIRLDSRPKYYGYRPYKENPKH